MAVLPDMVVRRGEASGRGIDMAAATTSSGELQIDEREARERDVRSRVCQRRRGRSYPPRGSVVWSMRGHRQLNGRACPTPWPLPLPGERWKKGLVGWARPHCGHSRPSPAVSFHYFLFIFLFYFFSFCFVFSFTSK